MFTEISLTIAPFHLKNEKEAIIDVKIYEIENVDLFHILCLDDVVLSDFSVHIVPPNHLDFQTNDRSQFDAVRFVPSKYL